MSGALVPSRRLETDFLPDYFGQFRENPFVAYQHCYNVFVFPVHFGKSLVIFSTGFGKLGNKCSLCLNQQRNSLFDMTDFWNCLFPHDAPHSTQDHLACHLP